MGLLSKINLSSLKEEASERISPAPKVDVDAIKWGSLGDFVFRIYQWPEQFSWVDEDEYTEYKTLAGVTEREKVNSMNRKATLEFKLFQRDVNEDTQQEGNVFEEDMMLTLSLIYEEKNSDKPLDLLKNNGELYIGSFSVNEVEVTVLEEDNKGLPMKVNVKLSLEGYPTTQL